MGLVIKKNSSLKKAGFYFTAILLLSVSVFTASQYFASQTFAADPTPTPESYFTFDDLTGTITAYNWTDGPKDLVIPRTIGGIDVINLGAAMTTGGGITSVFIPDSVTTIGDGAFSGNDISTINIPDSVTTIGGGAFGQNDITTLVIPDSVTSIGSAAFDDNPLVSVTIGTAGFSGTPTLDIFSNFSSVPTLTQVIIGNNVRTISNGSFSSTAITSLDLGDSVQTLGGGAFGSNLLTELYIPDSVTVLAGGAFGNSSELVNLTIGSDTYSGSASLTLSGDVFSYAPKLETLKFGNTLNTLTSGAFAGKTSLQSLDLGDSVTTITNGALQSIGISEVTLPVSLTNLSGGAFSGSPNLSKVTFMGPTITEASFYGTVIEEFYMNDDVTFDEWVVEAITEVVGTTGKYIRIYATADSSWFSAPDLTGIYMVNPAEVSLRYVDASGNELAPAYHAISDTLTDYSVAANPAADFSMYYRIGDSVSIPVVNIAGYVAPASKSFILGAGINNLTYAYSQVGLPNTGKPSLSDYVGYLIAIIVASTSAVYVRRML